MSGQAWNTVSPPPREHFAFWRDVVGEAFTPVSFTRSGEGKFVSNVSVTHVGPLRVAEICSQQQTVSRTDAFIAQRPGDVFFVNLALVDGTSARQHGRTATLRRGDLVVIDGAEPFELQFPEPFRQVSVTIPHDVLVPVLADRHAATAVAVSGRAGVGAVAATAIRTLAWSGDTVGDAEGRELADCLAQLLALAVGGPRCAPRNVGRHRLRQAAHDAVERGLADPSLSPATVARQVGVSVRYLHQLFADEGTTFRQWLLARRLERCHRDLGDATLGDWTVAQLAARHGIGDPAYFSRVFHARYGVTPRQIRPARLPRQRRAARPGEA